MKMCKHGSSKNILIKSPLTYKSSNHVSIPYTRGRFIRKVKKSLSKHNHHYYVYVFFVLHTIYKGNNGLERFYAIWGHRTITNDATKIRICTYIR